MTNRSATNSQNIYIAGHRGMVGSAIVRHLQALDCHASLAMTADTSVQGAAATDTSLRGAAATRQSMPSANIVTRTHAELDLIDRAAVRAFFAAEKPDQVYPKLGWTPEITFDELVAEMVREDLKSAERDELIKHHGKNRNRAITNKTCQRHITPLHSRSTPEHHPPNTPSPVFPDPHHYKLLKLIEANPAIQQREMAKAMGVSLGKANYCLQALVQKGLVKMDNFRRNDNKLTYSYLLTPGGIEEKARLTISFLKHKVAEYEAIRNEIEELRRDAEQDTAA